MEKVAATRVPSPHFKNRQAWIIPREELATVPTFIALPGIGDADPDFLALELGNLIFGGDFTARLMQELRAKNGWTYGVSSGFNQLLTPHAPVGHLFHLSLSECGISKKGGRNSRASHRENLGDARSPRKRLREKGASVKKNLSERARPFIIVSRFTAIRRGKD